MITIRPLYLIALPLTLAACAPAPVQTEILIVDEAPAVDGDTCGAANYQQYVGQQSPQISLPAGAVFRHYRSGDPVTMDFNGNRVNFEYDRSGKLVKVSCG